MFNYKWNLKDWYPAKGINKNWLNVFSTFCCWGGSSMWYKLAGYNIIGANDIDKQMAEVYKKNHNPKYFFLCPIWELLEKELPEELYNLDILDGSPPCSTFSMSGSREKVWKKEKRFKEWQAKQVLSDLFFDWIKLVDKLKPKIAIAENVKWMLAWNAKMYTQKVVRELNRIWYDVQLFLLNGASMWLPQKRERVFFVCKRKDLNFPKLELEFNEKPILFRDINEWVIKIFKDIGRASHKYYDLCKPGSNIATVHPTKSFFSRMKLANEKVANTLTAKCNIDIYNPDQRRVLTQNELLLLGSFPLDYNFLKIQPGYLIWMSVPPVMMAQLSYQIYLQLFSKNKFTK